MKNIYVVVLVQGVEDTTCTVLKSFDSEQKANAFQKDTFQKMHESLPNDVGFYVSVQTCQHEDQGYVFIPADISAHKHI